VSWLLVVIAGPVLAAGFYLRGWRPLRGRAFSAPQASDEQFRILFDRSPDVIVVVDPENLRILKVNRAGEVLVDRPGDTLIDKSLFEICPAEGVEELRELMLRTKAQGAASRLTTLIGRAGASVPVGASATAFPWGGSFAVLLTFRDIRDRVAGDRQRAEFEATLRAAADEWTHTFDALSIAVLLVSSEGIVRRLNKASRDLARRPDPSELTGTTLASLGVGEPWSSAMEAVRKARAGMGAYFRPISDPASGRTWNVGGSALARTGSAGNWVIVTIQETTEVVALEEALRRSERMAEIGTLISRVAHEVRNPLFAISALIDTLAAEPHAPPGTPATLELLREAAGRLGSLVQDLLDYARPSVRERTPAALEEVASAAIRECEPLARALDVQVSGRWPEGLPPVAMDRERMVRALQNVVQNAIQHSPTGTVVEVDVDRVSADGRPWLTCGVRDAGPGFAEEDLQRAFEPLFTRRRGGTGLGLSIARNVVEEHGGQIQLHNLPAGGAFVSIRLPLGEAGAAT